MIGPGTNLWSADGNYDWSADGFTGWSADGYEPTNLAVAISDLASVFINVGTITLAYDPLVPLGYVITGYPAALSEPPLGRVLNLVLSNGPAPHVTQSVVPDVVGQYYYDAQLAILAAGMLIAPPVWSLSEVSPGYVIAQSLAAGTLVNPQTQMTITVSGFPVINQPGVVVPVP
jgi:beta-lactam-binding protein with PASTA domain